MKSKATEGVEDKDKKTTTTSFTLREPPQMEEEVCPVCLETLPASAVGLTRAACCGVVMHVACHADILKSKMSHEQKNSCPLCRTRFPKNGREIIKRTQKWVKKGKAWAQVDMAGNYLRGFHGVTQSHVMAFKLYEKAAQQRKFHSLFLVFLVIKS